MSGMATGGHERVPPPMRSPLQCGASGVLGLEGAILLPRTNFAANARLAALQAHAGASQALHTPSAANGSARLLSIAPANTPARPRNGAAAGKTELSQTTEENSDGNRWREPTAKEQGGGPWLVGSTVRVFWEVFALPYACTDRHTQTARVYRLLVTENSCPYWWCMHACARVKTGRRDVEYGACDALPGRTWS